MVFIISIILTIIALIIIGLLLRKRVYDKVDKLEGWKMDIMNRNIAVELSRMKDLNLSGETEEKFESWRRRWDSIITKELGDIEELLYEAEHSADRYRFKEAKGLTQIIKQNLNEIENDLERILKQLNALLKAEEESRKGIEQLKPKIGELREFVSQNRSDFSRAIVRFEVLFDELTEMVTMYDELIENGDYAEGREIVKKLDNKLENLQEDINQFPHLYKQCKVEIPRQLSDLYDGIQEMKESKYRLEELGLEKEINEYQNRLIDCVHMLEKTGIEKVLPVIPEIEESIKKMYDQLEDEVLAKNFIDSKMVGFTESLNEFKQTFTETTEEVEQLKQAYYFEDEDLESYLALEKSINLIKANFTTLSKDIEGNQQLNSKLRQTLENGITQLDQIKENHEQFIELIETLRKDETDAYEQVEQTRRQINAINRKLRHSNIPGVPSFIWTLLDEAKNKNEHVLNVLDKQPIDIASVRKKLAEAIQAVEQVMTESDNVIEQAYLTERVIQYANRYRSNHASLAKELSEAERLFRKSNYELALERAAKAIEEVEPGALKRIEEQIESVS